MAFSNRSGPRARRALGILVGCGAAMLVAAPLVAQNPNGYISPEAWMALGPFQTPFGCGTNSDILTNHIPPGRIFCQYPEVGDELDEFDAAAAANDGVVYVGPTGPDGLPEWRVFDDNSTQDDDLDMNEDATNLGTPADDVGTFALTYVEYLGDSPIDAQICGNSDDGLQVWWDDFLIINDNACRGRPNPPNGQCQSTGALVVTPGVHRIVMGVWDRGGGFGGSCGIRVGGTLVTEASPDWFFQGTDPGAVVIPPCTDPAERAASSPGDPTACPPVGGGPLSVAITQALQGAPAGDTLTVTETVRGPFAIADVTAQDGGVVAETFPNGFTGDGFIDSWLLLGPFDRGPGAAANPAVADMELDYLANADLSINELDVWPKAGDTVDTDFGGAAPLSLGIKVEDPINPGGVPTWNAWSDPDDTIAFEDYYGSDVNEIMMYAVTYIDLAEDADLTLCVGSDDSIQVIFDDTEVHINSVARGSGGAGECQDSPAIGVWSAGQHRVLVKVFEGGGGHNFRLSIRDAATGMPPAGMTVCLDPEADPCVWAPNGVEITWTDVTRQALADGLDYSIDKEVGTFLFNGDTAGRKISGDQAFSILQEPQDFGPIADPPFPHAHEIGNPICGVGDVTGGGGSITLTGAGNDIWGQSDQFVFAYQEVTGDFSATVTIVDRQMGNSNWGKHGIMARGTCDPGSSYVYVADQQAAANFDNETAMQWRFVPGTNAAWDGRAGQLPDLNDLGHANTLRLDRVGDTFIGYALDENGDWGVAPGEWVELSRKSGTVDGLELPETVQLGLAVTSHDGCNTVIVTFEDWNVDLGTPAQAPSNLSCSGTATGVDLSWENVGAAAGEISIEVNGVEVATRPEGSTSASVAAADLEDGSNSITVRNSIGAAICGFFQGEELYINCGGPRLDEALGNDLGDGRIWEEDTLANPSPFLATANAHTADFASNAVPPFVVADTTLVEPDFIDDPLQSVLFSTERWDNADVTYRIPLPQGDYDVTLLFAEGCCSQGCEDIADPALSTGACRVFDLIVNGDLVADQFSQHVEASRGIGNALPNAIYGIALAKGPYRVENTNQIEITIDDLGTTNPPENASIKGIAIVKAGGGVVGTPFKRGDADASGTLNITDGIYVLNFLFLGGPDPVCKDAADADDSGTLNITDGIYILNFLFLGGPDPKAPGGKACGVDPTDEDGLDCGSYDPAKCQ